MRDWDAILADAIERGLSQTQVALEQGCTRPNVCKCCKQRGVRLVRGPRGALPRSPGAARRQVRRQARVHASWERRFAEAPAGLNRNEFCRRFGIGHSADLVQRAAQFGYVFRPSDAASKGRSR